MTLPAPPEAPAAPLLPGREVYTVSRLTLEARAVLEGSFPLLWVEGEISGFTAAGSGHCYFTLKDAHAQVRCVLWRARARLLAARPANGDRVLAHCRVAFYEARGEFQLDVQHLEPAGQGALLRAIEALRARLAAEGLFNAARKRTPPALPRRLVVITSAQGAAVHDVLTTLRARWPALDVTVLGVPVQGPGAPAAIAGALRQAGAHGQAALLVRGGGSVEDLMAFNDETVVRAVAACAVPVICGVGHEVDVTLADLAADVRAPTPTGAAQMAVPDQVQWLAGLAARQAALVRAAQRALRTRAQQVDGLERRLRHPAARVREGAVRLAALRARLAHATARRLDARRQQAARLERRLARMQPAARVAGLRARLDRATTGLHGAWRHAHGERGHALARAAGRLEALSPLATLARGFAVVRHARDGALVRDARDVPVGARIHVRLASGALGATVNSHDPQEVS